MTERLTLDRGQFETLLKSPERKTLPTAEQAEPLRPGEEDPSAKLQAARSEIEATAIQSNPLEGLRAAETASQPAPALNINQELKAITLRRELQSIRHRLPAPQRALSKAIHQPAIRAISEGAGKTVTRPSGLLGGGIVAFAGTSAYLLLAKHMGFQYNYGVFLVLFAGGFVAGLLLELIIRSTSRRKID